MIGRLLNAPMRIQSAVALGLLTLLGVCGVLLSVALAQNIADQQQSLIDSRERAGRLMRLAATDLSRNAIEEQTGDAQLFMGAASLAIARAELQQRISSIAATNNISIASAGNLPELTENGVTMIGLRIDFSGQHESVGKTVAAIEAGSPPLIVRHLTVRTAGAEQSGQPPELAAQLRVYAAVRVPTEPSTESGSADD